MTNTPDREHPIDVATRATLSFVTGEVRAGAALLEIGCGGGELALALRDAGYDIVAIDAEPDAVARTEARGVRAFCAEWPAFAPDPVDAVLFSRSLHHMPALAAAAAAAANALRAGGVVLAEDFAYRDVDRATVDWLLDVTRRAWQAGVVNLAADAFVVRLLHADDGLAAWHAEHDHDLHEPQEMRDALQQAVGTCAVREVPYLYRYLVPVLAPGPRAAQWLTVVYDEEQQLVADGRIRAIGRRFVARRAP
jgi:SAM-dependent methyltransferase